MRYRSIVAGLLLVGLLAGACGPPAASPSPAPLPPAGNVSPADAAAASAPADPLAPLPPLPGKVTVSYSSVSGTFVPLFLAADLGLFAKNGLDVDVTYIASGTTSMQSLIAGDLQFIVTSGAEPAAAYLAGAPARIVLGWFHALSALFLVDPSITRPEQLRGKPIGITRFGGQPHVAARLALTAWGLDPDTDVQYLQLGGTPEILAAMQQGAVVGGAFAPPTNVRGQRLGFRVLGDLTQMGIPYQSGVLVGLQPYLEANPEVTKRFVRAILEGIKVSLTDDDATRAAMARFTRVDDVELLDETIRYYRTAVQKVPYPTIEGLQTVLNDLAENDPRARTIRPQEFINTAALEQLEREGVIRALYGE